MARQWAQRTCPDRHKEAGFEAYLCVSQESSNCGYPMQDVQTGLTKKRKRKKERKGRKEKDKVFCCKARGENIMRFVVGVSNKPKELVSDSNIPKKMPRTRMTICVPGNAKIWDQINESGRVLAALIGKKFPVADEVWQEMNVFNQMIDRYGLMDTWVTKITPDDREVSDVALVFCFSFRFH